MQLVVTGLTTFDIGNKSEESNMIIIYIYNYDDTNYYNNPDDMVFHSHHNHIVQYCTLFACRVLPGIIIILYGTDVIIMCMLLFRNAMV